jgi:hypothetical protein
MSATAIIPSSARSGHAGYVIAWGFCLLFYFGQYAIRSVPVVMVPEPTNAFRLTILGVNLLLGLDYYTYATFAIVSGAALDRLGSVGIAGVVLAIILACLLRETGNAARPAPRPILLAKALL